MTLPIIGDLVPRNLSGGVPVDLLFKDVDIFNPTLSRSAASPTTLTAPVAVDAYQITVASTTGFTASCAVVIVQAGKPTYYGRTVGAPVGSVVTLGTPTNSSFSVGAAVVPLVCNMAVNGTTYSGGRAIFSATADRPVSLIGATGRITDNLTMYDSSFGGIAALSRGVVIRRNNADGTYLNLKNWRTNGEIRLSTPTGIEYSDSAGPAQTGLYFALFLNDGDGTIRLEAGQSIEVLIQDDLSALILFELVLYGLYDRIAG